MSNSLKYLIDYVKSELLRRNWSERELARNAGLTPASVNFAVRGDKDIRHSTIEAIASALQVSPHYLLMSPDDRARWDYKGVELLPANELENRLKKLEQLVMFPSSLPSQEDVKSFPAELQKIIALAKQLPPEELGIGALALEGIVNVVARRKSSSKKDAG